MPSSQGRVPALKRKPPGEFASAFAVQRKMRVISCSAGYGFVLVMQGIVKSCGDAAVSLQWQFRDAGACFFARPAALFAIDSIAIEALFHWPAASFGLQKSLAEGIFGHFRAFPASKNGAKTRFSGFFWNQKGLQTNGIAPEQLRF